ncbi:MAG TPA: type IX secretion system membrane protein PorP/SprF [Salinivirga sp.]|uniref:PorP/SprF family type IX secretion system membrane protein n=1 Tax=Salinivirga sp. TaxID=1970192 RepID=UPI002B49B7A2|nr:type IX secretion system membrane protein PorP/SprF [Salinivirga sp.]HKK60291.1 type IX secretion system membrane protein PorP/SprF [Salinivirga sp.]
MRIIFVFIILTLSTWSMAQTIPHATLFQYNHMMVNPGYSGMNDGITVNTVVRNQWMGWEGAPSTQNFNVHMPFKLFGAEHGAGLTLMNDEAGFENNIAIGLNYAYRRDIAEGTMGIGIGFGFYNQSLSGTFDPIEEGDGLIPQGEDEALFFDLNFGGFYKTDKLYFGFSVNHLTAPEVKYKNSTGGSYPYYQRAAFLTAGYRYQLSNPLFELEPNIMVYTTGSSTQAAFNAIMHYKSRFWGGVGYRVIDAASVMAGAEIIEGLNIGLAYDIPTSQVINATAGSFEFTVQYIFKVDLEKDDRIYRSVRFL